MSAFKSSHRLLLLTLAIFLFASACSTVRTADLVQPGATEISLWRSEPIPLEPGWRHLGTERFLVRGEIWNSSLPPMDQIETMLFVREGEKGPHLLFLSRVLKTGFTEIFTFLGGSKTFIAGYAYREGSYGLSSDTGDAEYKRYFGRIRQEGLTPAPAYSVLVRDRLPIDTVLIRIMELVPGEAWPELPAFGKLYPQESLETFDWHRR